MTTSKDIFELILSRRTIQKYDPKEVPSEYVRRGIEAAVRAPNHKMTWPWKYVEIGKSIREEMATIAVEARSAAGRRPLNEDQAADVRNIVVNVPVLIAAVQKLNGDEDRQKEDYASCACAIENFSLVMWEKGVGVKWSTRPETKSDKTYELLGIDREKELIIGFLWVGYPAQVPETNRPSVDEVYSVVEK